MNKHIPFKFVISIFSLLILSTAFHGCGDDSPTATEQPPLPSAIPNALMLDNLSLVQSLERSRRSDTVLSYITGHGLQLDGRPSDGDGWEFAFVRKEPLTGYSWFIFSDGHIEEPAGNPLSLAGPPIGTTDIASHLKTNSDRAINIGRKNGGNAYLKKYPNAHVEMRYSGSSCEMRFEQLGAPCPIVVVIDSKTGEVLQKDLTCIEQ